MDIAILGIREAPEHHGVKDVVASLVPHLVSFGHRVTIYGHEGCAEPSGDCFGATVRPVRCSSRKKLEAISHLWNASIDARRLNFDIVHVHAPDPCFPAWLPNPRYAVVATSHGRPRARKTWSLAGKTRDGIAERLFIRVPQAVTCVSKPLCEYYREKYKRDVAYIPNGITIRNAPDACFLRTWNLEPGGYLFSSVGRIERTKGLTTLLEAYRMLETSIPLVVAGAGSATDPSFFEELRRNKPERVQFVGFLTGDYYYAMHAHARAFIFPSEREIVSMTLLEALSFGVPTIFSDIPENIAVASNLGFPFRASDAVSLEEAIRFVLARDGEARAVALRAQAAVRKNHDWSVVAGLYDEVYRRVVDRLNHRG